MKTFIYGINNIIENIQFIDGIISKTRSKIAKESDAYH